MKALIFFPTRAPIKCCLERISRRMLRHSRRIRTFSRVLMHTWNDFELVFVEGRSLSSPSAGSLLSSRVQHSQMFIIDRSPTTTKKPFYEEFSEMHLHKVSLCLLLLLTAQVLIIVDNRSDIKNRRSSTFPCRWFYTTTSICISYLFISSAFLFETRLRFGH